MGYVALSRVRSLLGIRLMGLNNMAIQVNKEALDLNRQLQALSKQTAKKLHTMPPEQRTQKQKRFLSSLGIKTKTKVYSVAQIRKAHPSAYQKWTTQEEQRLINLYKTGKTIKELAHTLGRQRGGIRSRLKELKESGRV